MPNTDKQNDKYNDTIFAWNATYLWIFIISNSYIFFIYVDIIERYFDIKEYSFGFFFMGLFPFYFVGLLFFIAALSPTLFLKVLYYRESYIWKSLVADKRYLLLKGHLRAVGVSFSILVFPFILEILLHSFFNITTVDYPNWLDIFFQITRIQFIATSMYFIFHDLISVYSTRTSTYNFILSHPANIITGLIFTSMLVLFLAQQYVLLGDFIFFSVYFALLSLVSYSIFCSFLLPMAKYIYKMFFLK